jgi:hypothetical protein
MRARRINPPLLHQTGTPSLWVRTAAAAVEDSLAVLCMKQWTYARVAIATMQTHSAKHPRRRG